ncbi:MAG: type II secretion system protein M [Pseudomonas sp.]|uniref:type II secretion system protein M n=1 Tax=Pseudomonas sp. TaxID=306 RepID=UPI00339A05E1
MMNFKQQLASRAGASPLWSRWQQLAPRERVLLVVMAAFVLLALLYLVVWQPVSRELKSARTYYQEQRELNAYLLQNADQVRQQVARPAVNLAPEQLQGLVTQNAQQHGLVVERFDSDGDGLLVSLAKAPFEALLRCFTELEAQGVILGEVNLDRAGEGLVDARVTLKTAAQ